MDGGGKEAAGRPASRERRTRRRKPHAATAARTSARPVGRVCPARLRAGLPASLNPSPSHTSPDASNASRALWPSPSPPDTRTLYHPLAIASPHPPARPTRAQKTRKGSAYAALPACALPHGADRTPADNDCSTLLGSLMPAQVSHGQVRRRTDQAQCRPYTRISMLPRGLQAICRRLRYTQRIPVTNLSVHSPTAAQLEHRACGASVPAPRSAFSVQPGPAFQMKEAAGPT